MAAGLFVSLAARAQTLPHRGVTAPRSTRHPAAPTIVIDTHADTTLRLVDQDCDLATPNPDVNLNFEKARAGGLGAEFFSIWLDQAAYKGHYVERAMDMIDAVYQQAARHPDQMVMAFRADDIVRARSGPHPRLAALMGIEGGHVIGDDLRVLRDFYRLGIRYLTLTHSSTNDWADSSGDIADPSVAHHDGLTDFGVAVVREMNRLGMMVDISHVSDRTFYKTLVVSRAPVIASHSSARALTDSLRNMTDDMLRALARNGGVVNVNFCSCFVDENFRKALVATQPEVKAAVAAARQNYRDQHNGAMPPFWVEERVAHEFGARLPRPPFKSLIDHIDHMAKVAGVDHVGLGSDFDGTANLFPQGIDSVADLPKIREALAARGYSEADLDKMFGGNMLRVMRQVERVGRELQKEKPLPATPLYGPEVTR